MIVQVGPWRGEYEFFRTTAPRRYDGGGTITLYEGGGERVVAVEKASVNWHRSRYLSGLFTMEPEEGDQLERWAADILLKRMLEMKP